MPPSTGDRVLSVTGVTQRFGDRLVLDDVDLCVPPGEVIWSDRTARARRR
jgi:ABC-type transporter Mla maintaining outer membrane lipid asymmetry ATPase subunit MlaF